VDEKIIAVKAYLLFPPPAFRSFSRNFLAPLGRHAFRPRLAALPAEHYGGWVFAVVGDSFFNSPVSTRMTWTALPITSAGRFSPLGPLGTSASRNIRENAIGIDFERAGPSKAKGVHWHYSLRFSDCALDVVARISDAIRTHGPAIGSDPEKFNIKKHPAHPALALC
jgi:hypothetical protein